MECISIDFDVLETNNTKKIMIGDTSQNWLHAENKPAYLHITLPASKTEKIFTFTKKTVNVFNSVNLGLSPKSRDCNKKEYADLPDGVYKIKLQSIFEDIYIEKYYLKTDQIQREIAKKVVNHELKSSKRNENFAREIMKVDYNLLASKSFLLECDLVQATRYYNEAVRIINSI